MVFIFQIGTRVWRYPYLTACKPLRAVAVLAAHAVWNGSFAVSIYCARPVKKFITDYDYDYEACESMWALRQILRGDL